MPSITASPMNINTNIDNLRPEDRFILACLQHQQSLPGLNLDEDLLIHRMKYHRVTSMVYQHLLKIDALTLLSTQAQAKLKDHYHLNIAHNLAIIYLLKKISTVLEKNNIETIALKGAMFIQSFPDYSLVREMDDLDIMVKSKKLYSALEILHTIGFSDSFNFRLRKNKRKNWSIKYASNALSLQNDRDSISSIIVELHWQFFSIFNQTKWSEKKFWERAKYCPEQGVYNLDPADTLLHLCAHQCNNLQIYLYGLVDVANLLMFWSEKIDWLEVIHRAKYQGVLLHVVNILRLSNELLNAPLPDVYFTELKSYELKAKPGYEFLIERLFQKELIENGYKADSLVNVFRRLEYSSFWQGLWFEINLPIPPGIRLRLNYYIGRHLRKIMFSSTEELT